MGIGSRVRPRCHAFPHRFFPLFFRPRSGNLNCRSDSCPIAAKVLVNTQIAQAGQPVNIGLTPAGNPKLLVQGPSSTKATTPDAPLVAECASTSYFVLSTAASLSTAPMWRTRVSISTRRTRVPGRRRLPPLADRLQTTARSHAFGYFFCDPTTPISATWLNDLKGGPGRMWAASARSSPLERRQDVEPPEGLEPPTRSLQNCRSAN